MLDGRLSFLFFLANNICSRLATTVLYSCEFACMSLLEYVFSGENLISHFSLRAYYNILFVSSIPSFCEDEIFFMSAT